MSTDRARSLVGVIDAVVFTALLTVPVCSSQNLIFVYTSNSYSNNVSGFTLNTASKSLTPIQGSPFSTGYYPGPLGSGAMATDPSGRFLYLTAGAGYPDSCRGIEVYSISPATGSLAKVPGSPFGCDYTNGAGQFVIDTTGRYLFDATTYGSTVSGNVSISAINTDGTLAPEPFSPVQLGLQDPCLAIYPKTPILYVVDQITFPTTITPYLIDSATGSLNKLPNSITSINAVNLPQCLTFDSGGRFAFLTGMNQTGMNQIFGYSVDSATGILRPIPGSPFPVSNASSLAITPDGRFLYVIQTTPDGEGYPIATILSFSVNNLSGALTQLPVTIPTSANLISPVADSSGFLFAVDYGGETDPPQSLWMFSIDSITGNLTQAAGSPFLAASSPTQVTVASPRSIGGLTLSNASPTTAGNTGSVTIDLYGSAFQSGMQIALSIPGQQDLIQIAVNILSGSYLTAIFDLLDVPPGTYDLIVTNPDGTKSVLASYFTIMGGGAPDLYIDLTGRIVGRPGQPQIFNLTITNRGTVDGTSTVAWVKFPSSFTWTAGPLMQPSNVMQNGSDTVLYYEIAGRLPVGETIYIPLLLMVPNSPQYVVYSVEAGGGSQ